MLNQPIITAARKGQFTLDVMAQITGVPARLIAATVKPSRHGNNLYSLKRVVLFFESEKWATAAAQASPEPTGDLSRLSRHLAG